MKLNPLLAATATPPIPGVKGWAAGYRRGKGGLIDLSQAVPGYPPPDRLLSRLGAAAADRRSTDYGDILGDGDLREHYAAHASALYGGMIEEDEVAITAGCNQAFVVAMMALAKAGEAILLPNPWYFNHKMTLDFLGIETVAVPCRPEAGFVPDAGEAEELIDGRVRAVVLVTPNNPTGAIYPPETIAAFAELCSRRRIALVIDETYRDFIGTDGASPHDLFVRQDWRETVVQLYSFSKAYCIPGHRAGAMVADAAFLNQMAKILDCVQICPPRAPQQALVWAIDALAEWRDRNTTIILDRAAAFHSAIAETDGWSIGSIGAYFAYLRHPFSGRSSADVARWLAAERGVLTLPGSYFGEGQDDFLRVAFANVDVTAIAELPARLNETRVSAKQFAAAGAPQ